MFDWSMMINIYFRLDISIPMYCMFFFLNIPYLSYIYLHLIHWTPHWHNITYPHLHNHLIQYIRILHTVFLPYIHYLRYIFQNPFHFCSHRHHNILLVFIHHWNIDLILNIFNLIRNFFFLYTDNYLYKNQLGLLLLYMHHHIYNSHLLGNINR